MYAKTISKEQINLMPVKVFEGNIVLVENMAEAQRAFKILENKKVLGFDTETKPAFKKGQKNQVALMQLVDGENAFLFRLNKIGMPQELRNILSSPEVLKIGAAIKDDLKALATLCSLRIEGFVDLQPLAQTYGIESISLQKITAIVLNFKISKRQQISNWEADQLTDAQLKYAATDGWVGLRIFQSMQHRLGSSFAYNTLSSH
jgi:ribonuclease D